MDANDVLRANGAENLRAALDEAPIALASPPDALGQAPPGEDWSDPKPLPSGLRPVAAFEPGFLPETIAPWVMDIAERMQAPPDFVAASAIVALGSVIGR